jgi:hypothetical protein
MKYMGIDYHKQHFVATMMNEKGSVLSRDKVSMIPLKPQRP